MTTTAHALLGQALAEVVARAKSGKAACKVGLMASGSEHGQEEFLIAAEQAMQIDPAITVVGVGPKPALLPTGMEWITTNDCGADVAKAMETALQSGQIKAAVALHYPFPLGVTTIGRVIAPASGKTMLLASTTGTSAGLRAEAMLRNAVMGVAVAKALGQADPSIGILNLEGAPQVLRSLTRLAEKGYKLRFGASKRADGGSLLRGNDLLQANVDICVCDTLTGNVLMKLFGAWTSGGSYEVSGFGYGPSVGAGWKQIVCIVSRASGAPVIANALTFAADMARANLPLLVEKELTAAKAAGLDAEIESLMPQKTAEVKEDVVAPAAEPTDEEIHGIDVLDLETATRCLWAKQIYAEAAMGCTGPVIKLASKNLEKAKAILKENNYI